MANFIINNNIIMISMNLEFSRKHSQHTFSLYKV